MSDGITGSASYKCLECGAKHFLQPDEFYFDAESGSERSMGTEAQHVAEFDEPCHNCANEIHLKFEVWEYPVGIINYTNEEISGAEILNSDFEIYHKPPEETIRETVQLIKPLLSFRFDKFSELFVEFWIASYKKSPKPTTIISIITIIITLTSIGFSVYQSETKRIKKINEKQNYANQFTILKETEQNLNNLANFITNKMKEIEATQQLIKNLERKKSELEPIVNANQDIIDAIFLKQRRETEQKLWWERAVSFGLGILASLLASIIWHFITRFRENRKIE